MYAYLKDTLPDHTVINPGDRLDTLATLREGAGVTVLTGPAGAPFWLLASIEVNVRIVPDGLDMNERTEDEIEWALRAQGVPRTVAQNMAVGYAVDSPPTERHRLHSQWVRAVELTDALPRNVAPTIYARAGYTVIRDPAEQIRFLDGLDHMVALDGEWDIDTKSIHSLEVADADHAWHLPVVASDYESPGTHGGALRAAMMRAVQRVPTIWHNAKADLNALWIGDPLDAFGSDLHDTIILAYLAGENELGLKHLARTYLGRDPMDYPKGHVGGLSTLPVELGARYGAAGDARNTYDLYHMLRAKVRAMGDVWQVYETIERPIVPIVASMERYGTPVDVPTMQRLEGDFGATAEGIRSMWWARERLDISNDMDTRALVKRRTGFDPGSVRADVLAKVEDDWMDSVMGYRRVRHRKRGFLTKHRERWEAAGCPNPYILWSSFNQAGSTDPNDPRSFRRAPRSGRFSSSGDAGNLQNQPGDIRDIFTAPPGCLFWSLDYKNLEMNIAAGLSGDPSMIEVLSMVCHAPEDGECPHSPKCGDMHDDFQLRIKARTGQDVGRRAAKAGNFLSQYGGHADQLGVAMAKERAFLEYEVLKLIVETHREAYPAYYGLGRTTIETAKMNGGHSETHFGRWRIDSDLFSPDSQMRGHAERALFNHVIQGTAADILKLAMKLAVPVLRHYGAHLSMQVHDELCGWVPEGVAEPFIATMRAIMESIRIPNIALKVEGGAGRTWADVH
jgi:DNA polymerase I-like protein with 3'-5' exonuclease and polymerase domains